MKCRCGNEELEVQGAFNTEPMQAWVICRACGGRWSGTAHSSQHRIGRGPAMAIANAVDAFIKDGGKEDERTDT